MGRWAPSGWFAVAMAVSLGAWWTGSLGAGRAVAENPRQPAEKASANWPRWRGPLSTGEAPDSDPPVVWDSQTHVRWKTPLPGEGSSTPIVWEDRVFVTVAIPTDRPADEPPVAHPDAKTRPPEVVYEFAALALDREDGRIVWRRTLREEVPHEGKHPTNTYASASPVTDGRRLIVSFGSRGIYCLDLDGRVLWERQLGRMRTRYGWGEAVSPALDGDTVVVAWDQEDQSFVMALDAATGQTRWQAERDEPTSWATPLIVTRDGRRRVILNGTNRVRCYDLVDGQVLWQCGGQTVNAIPSPLPWREYVVCMSGYRGAAAAALPLDARGDLTDTDRVLWRHDRGTPYVPSPLLVDDRLYFTRGNTNLLTCLDMATGQPLCEGWRLPGLTSLYASPVAARGRLYFVDRDGTTLVLRHPAAVGGQSAEGQSAGEVPFEVLATNRLGEAVDASPVIVGRQLFLRGAAHLYCLEQPGK